MRFLRVHPEKLTNDAVFRYEQLGMRQHTRHEEEERIAVMLVEESKTLLLNQVLRIRAERTVIIIGKIDALIIVPNMVGIIIMRQQLAVISPELIDVLPVRIPFRAGRS